MAICWGLTLSLPSSYLWLAHACMHACSMLDADKSSGVPPSLLYCCALIYRASRYMEIDVVQICWVCNAAVTKMRRSATHVPSAVEDYFRYTNLIHSLLPRKVFSNKNLSLNISNSPLARGLVNISATCRSIWIYSRATDPSWIVSLRKWYLMSICLKRSRNTRLQRVWYNSDCHNRP